MFARVVLLLALAGAAGCLTDFDLATSGDAGTTSGVTVESEPLRCIASDPLFFIDEDDDVALDDVGGPLVDVVTVELGPARRPHTLFFQAGGLAPAAGAIVFVGTSEGLACGEGEHRRAALFRDVPPRAIARALVTELGGAPAILTLGPEGALLVAAREDGGSFRVVREAQPGLDALPGVFGAAVADADGDGAEDIALVSSDGAIVAGVDGARSALLGGVGASGRVWWADFDGDGALDLLAAPDPRQHEDDPTLRGGSLLLGDGDGGFEPWGLGGRLSSLSAEGPIAVVDLDLDGDPDIVQWSTVPGRAGLAAHLLRNESSRGQVRLFPPELLPGFGPDAADPLTRGLGNTTIADFDRDGYPEVAALGDDVSVMVRGGPSPHVRDLLTFPRASIQPSRWSIADADADGDLDVAVVLTDGVVSTPVMGVSEDGAARALVIRVVGPPNAGTQVCLMRQGTLPGDGRCVARPGSLVAHSLGIASTAQSEPTAVRTFQVPPPDDHVDVRVVVRVPGGSRAYDVLGLAVGQRYTLTLPPR